jgi:TolA-binding protein
MSRASESGRRELPSIPADALRDIAVPARVERVWRRLERDLGEGRGTRSASAWRRVARPLAFVAVFVAGVGVGGVGWGGIELGGRAWPSFGQTALAPEVTTWVDEEPAGVAARAPEIAPPQAPRSREATSELSQRRPRSRSARGSRVHEGAVAVAPAPVAIASARKEAPGWYGLWRNDDLEAARLAIQAQGGFAAVIEQASPEQLMAMADIARSAQESSHAIAALRRVVERFPWDPNAPIAALTLGNMLERAGDRAGAAQAYQVARSLSPGGEFAEDALAHEVDSALEHGELEHARALLEQYAREFPTAQRLPELRTAVERASRAERGRDPSPRDAAVRRVEAGKAEPGSSGQPIAPDGGQPRAVESAPQAP